MGKLIPIIGAAVVALIIGAGAAWVLKPVPDIPAAERGPIQYSFMYPIKDRVVNLADPGAKRYIKVSLALEVPDKDAAKRKAPPTPADQKAFEDEFGQLYSAKILDVLTTVLAAKKTEDVVTPEGKDRLREEVKARINSFLAKDQQVSKVFLTDFIIQ